MGWNGSGDKNAAPVPKKKVKMPPSKWRGLVALLVVVALGGAAVWWFVGGRGATRPAEVGSRVPLDRAIAEVKPQLPAYRPVLTNMQDMVVLPNGVITNKPKTIAEAIAMVRLKPGFHSYKSVDEVFSKTNYHQIGEYKTLNLKSSTEAQLSLIASRRRDQIMPPMPPMPPAMEKDFQAALDNFLQANEGDTEADVKQKKKIEMMKEMMLHYVKDEGMTPGQALHEIEKDHNRSANLYQLYRGEYAKMVRNNDPNADAFYERARSELRTKGAPTFDKNGNYEEE